MNFILIKNSHICEAMTYLEEKGIVHRDLAASNVLISQDDIAKVSDFGLAKKILDENKNGVRIRIKWTAPEAIKEKVLF
jgi:c-src tyrosine kinase